MDDELSILEALRGLRADQPPTLNQLRALRRLERRLPSRNDLEHAASLCLWDEAEADDVNRRVASLKALADILA